MTRPTITVDPAERGFCEVCGSQVLVRTVHLGAARKLRTCALCRVAVREALVAVAGATRDALRAEAAEAVA